MDMEESFNWVRLREHGGNKQMDPNDRKRAEARMNRELPEPLSAPVPLDPVTEAKMAWFMENRKNIQETLKAEIEITPMGQRRWPIRSITPALTIRG